MPPSCTVPACTSPASIELTAQPSGMRFPPTAPEQIDFGFCSKHGPVYADLGYRPKNDAYQESLGVEVFDS